MYETFDTENSNTINKNAHHAVVVTNEPQGKKGSEERGQRCSELNKKKHEV